MTVGGQNFDVVVDTGSSDPWLVAPNYTCIDPNTGKAQDDTYCYFGTPYESASSTTYVPILGENFNITYADEELLNGAMAFEKFTLGGVTVPGQKFGLVDYAAWYGDGYSSGLVGFAYGTLTSAYSGTNLSQDQRGNTLMYNPLFVNMYNLSLIAPVFSLAIDRDPDDGGLLALGGIPDIPHSPYWVSTPIQSVGVFSGTTTLAYEFYTIQADGFAYSASLSTQFNPYTTNNPYKTHLLDKGTVIIDSGTSLLYAPDAVAAGVGAAFSPPASYSQETDTYYVSCTARAPVFGVSIGSKIFYVNALDLIVPSSEGQCVSGVQPNMGGLTILGDVWMKNVISVFDIGAEEMRFAAREFYGMRSQGIPATT